MFFFEIEIRILINLLIIFLNFLRIVLIEKKLFDNIGRLDWEVIENLKKDKNIIIKEVDKGNVVIIMDRDYYKYLCFFILENEFYYEK